VKSRQVDINDEILARKINLEMFGKMNSRYLIYELKGDISRLCIVRKYNENYLIVHFTVLYCIVLQCTVLYCTVLYCTALYCTVLQCTVLYCTVLQCTVLYCTAQYCAVQCCAYLRKQSMVGSVETHFRLRCDGSEIYRD
jgi:hypothetical protein